MRGPEPLARDLAEGMLRGGHTVAVRAGGRSMEPALEEGDILRVEPASAASLRIGQVALVVTGEGHLVAHRVISRRGEGLVTSGDAVGGEEGPWPDRAVLGRVTAVLRAGEWRPLDHPREARGLRDLLDRSLLPGMAGAVGMGGALLAGAGPVGCAGGVVAAWAVARRAARAARRRDAAILAASLVVLEASTSSLLTGGPPILGVSPLGVACWALAAPAARRLPDRGPAVLAAVLVLGALAAAWLTGVSHLRLHVGWLPYLGVAVSWPAALLGLGARAALAVLLAGGLAQAGRWPRRPGFTRRRCAAGVALALLEAWLAAR